jgi:hypothetical protein
MDMRSRMLKVTFKGRDKARKWVGWTVPLPNRALLLVEYDTIQKRAKQTHELVMMVYYSFVVEVHNGEMPSRELLELGMGLDVQALDHTVLPGGGIQEW